MFGVLPGRCCWSRSSREEMGQRIEFGARLKLCGDVVSAIRMVHHLISMSASTIDWGRLILDSTHGDVAPRVRTHTPQQSRLSKSMPLVCHGTGQITVHIMRDVPTFLSHLRCQYRCLTRRICMDAQSQCDQSRPYVMLVSLYRITQNPRFE